jgi:hypothetical protein
VPALLSGLLSQLLNASEWLSHTCKPDAEVGALEGALLPDDADQLLLRA